MDNQALISVIVPAFNGGQYLEPCLNALCAQTLPRHRYEVIFIDNRSTDGSLELARRIPGLIVLEEPERGAYAARNRGVAQAKGDLLVFLDCDCQPDADWLEVIAAAFKPPETALVLGEVRFGGNSISLELVADYESHRTEYVWAQTEAPLYYGYAGNMAVRRDVFQRCGPFLHVARGADSIFANKVREACGLASVRCVRRARVRHLEVTNVWHWLRKMMLYSRSCETSRTWAGSRSLNLGERCQVMRRTIAGGGYGWVRAARLAVLLALGAVAFEAGRSIQLLRKHAPGWPRFRSRTAHRARL